MPVTLTATDGPLRGTRVTLDGHDTLLAGKSAAARLRLPADDPAAAEFHFLLEANGSVCRVGNLAGPADLVIPGQKPGRLQVHDLRAGSRFRAGASEFEVGMVPTPNSAVTAEYPKLPADFNKVTGYKTRERVSSDEMGSVFESERESDGRPVRVRTIFPAVAPDPEQAAQVVALFEPAGRFRHPGVAALLQAGYHEGKLFLVSEAVKGVDAAEWRRGWAPPPAACARLAGEVLAVLEEAHEHDISAGEIKPACVAVTDPGVGTGVRVQDLGVLRAYQLSPVAGATVLGAPGLSGYTAPELATNYRRTDPRADVYAAGALLYFLLTGRPPLAVEDNEDKARRVARLLAERPAPVATLRRDVPAGLAEAVHRALDHDPAKRFADAPQMRAAVQAFAG